MQRKAVFVLVCASLLFPAGAFGYSQRVATQKSESLIRSMAKGDFVSPERDFSPAMQRAMPPRQLAGMWNLVTSLTGPLQSLGETLASRHNYIFLFQSSAVRHTISVKTKFKNSSLWFIVGFDNSGQVTRLAVNPVSAEPPFGYDALGWIGISSTYVQIGGQVRPLDALPKAKRPVQKMRVMFFYRGDKTSKNLGACATLRFSLDKTGVAHDVGLWALYPSRSKDFALLAAASLYQWRWLPAKGQTKLVSIPTAFAEFTYVKPHWRGNTRVAADLSWVCSQPPMHGVTIVAASEGTPAAATAPATATGGVAPAHDALTTAVIPASVLPATAAPGSVRAHFCVDAQGRAAYTEIEAAGAGAAYSEAARAALEAVHFSPRLLGKKRVLTCGATVPISFSGGTAGTVGTIGALEFEALSGHSPEPRLLAQTPAKTSLHIPPGTRLPPVARAVVRLCIDKDGTVSDPVVVQADPPQLIDRAAIATVRGWRFAAPDRRMCDVYEGVQFPLGKQAG